MGFGSTSMINNSINFENQLMHTNFEEKYQKYWLSGNNFPIQWVLINVSAWCLLKTIICHAGTNAS